MTQRAPVEVYADVPPPTWRSTAADLVTDRLLRRRGWGAGSARLHHSLEGLEIRPPLYGLDMYQRFRDAEIVLNSHTDIAVRCASNLRLWESTGVGACLVTDEKENLPDLFGEGQPATYRSIQEAAERVLQLLGDPEAARRIARRSQDATMQRHTFEHRMAELLTILERPAGRGAAVPSAPALSSIRPAPVSRRRRMKIAIDARVHDGEFGGVQQATLGLARGLGELEDTADEEYHFIVWPDHNWLVPALTGPCRALVVPDPNFRRLERSALGRVAPEAARAASHLLEAGGRVLPSGDAVADLSGFDLVHFMRQRGFRTALPNIYQPHDLQHVHHPEFFHPLQRAYRHRAYRAMAAQADRVAVMTASARQDVTEHLGTAAEQVIVVPWASIFDGRGEDEPALPLGYPERFLLYPAQTWSHKNHAGLVRALALLRQAHGLDVAVVCTGKQTEHWGEIEVLARELGVDDLLVAPGYVEMETLRALYTRAVALVFPSLYEGWGLPVVEAFALGTPAACSAISPLREIAGEAARLFDPEDPSAIAAEVAVLWTSEEERERLVALGDERVHLFSWPRTAAVFRAHYREILGLPLTTEDEELLQAQPPV